MRPTATLLLTFGVTALLWAGTAKADDVYLVNGKVYEGVVAEEVPAGIRIHLPFGRIVIPHSQVARVVEAPTALEELVLRRQRLEEEPRASGQQWLALSQWAQGQGLEHAARQAALTAARLEPELAGLEAVLEPAGFVFDPQRRRWVSESEHMARQGYVLSGGRWVPLEVHRELERDALQRRRLAAETALLDAQRMQVEREALAPRREDAPATHAVGYQAQLFPWYSPAVVVVPSPRPPARPPNARPPLARPHGHGYDALIDRAPGSLIGVGRGIPPTAERPR